LFLLAAVTVNALQITGRKSRGQIAYFRARETSMARLASAFIIGLLLITQSATAPQLELMAAFHPNFNQRPNRPVVSAFSVRTKSKLFWIIA
jgi:hypothetical protein